jgi:HD-GYP domain-containing protein (c-di-GMP phosphodiesterase class II)
MSEMPASHPPSAPRPASTPAPASPAPSNRVLDKEGPLDGDERRAMQQHPAFTWVILGHVRAFADFAPVAATHHEKLDGSGYLWRLRGDELDVPSRALVVADIHEALTADRPYRAGMPVERALGIREADRGTRLDAAAVDALAALVRAGDAGPRDGDEAL